MSVKALLDDVAAEATVGLRVDLAAATRQAEQRRSQLRWQAGAAMTAAVAVAAAVVLGTVLLPGGLFRADSVTPAGSTGGNGGLPAHWYYSPPWTPPITRHPMPAASMILAVQMRFAKDDFAGLNPVLVSADGTSYASLPWSRWDCKASLAPSGLEVAWLTQALCAPTANSEGRPKRAVLHRLRLSDGHLQNIELPAGVQLTDPVWDGTRLLADASTDGHVGTGYELVAGSDRLRTFDAMNDVYSSQVSADDSPLIAGDNLATNPTAVEPGGNRTVGISYEVGPPSAHKFTLMIGRKNGAVNDVSIPVTGADPITDAVVLGWAEGGIVVRIQSQGAYTSMISLRLYDPQTHTSRIVSRREGTFSYPIAVAPDVVGAGLIVPGVKPKFSPTDRSHVWWLIHQEWRQENRLYLAVILIIGLLLAGFGMRSRRRRRAEKDAVVMAASTPEQQTAVQKPDA